jgi:3-oxoacyl-[acyl-carrier protein] reductase
MSVSIDLSGKVILVIGCARGGIGGATARAAAAAGARVIALDFDATLVEQTVSEINAGGGSASGLRHY